MDKPDVSIHVVLEKSSANPQASYDLGVYISFWEMEFHGVSNYR